MREEECGDVGDCDLETEHLIWRLDGGVEQPLGLTEQQDGNKGMKNAFLQ